METSEKEGDDNKKDAAEVETEKDLPTSEDPPAGPDLEVDVDSKELEGNAVEEEEETGAEGQIVTEAAPDKSPPTATAVHPLRAILSQSEYGPLWFEFMESVLKPLIDQQTAPPPDLDKPPTDSIPVTATPNIAATKS